MEWKKLNFDEIGYFCKSTRAATDFECYPFICQMEMLLGILYYYGIKRFQIKDIQNIYLVLHLKKMKSDGILKPQPKKLQTILGRLEADGRVMAEQGGYIVTDKNKEDCGFYKADIEKGYEKDYISDWIAYDRKNSMLKMEYLPQQAD